VPGLELAAVYQPAGPGDEVGGDFSPPRAELGPEYRGTASDLREG
jgi:hypothetical protein